MFLCSSHQGPQFDVTGAPLQQRINVILNIKHLTSPICFYSWEKSQVLENFLLGLRTELKDFGPLIFWLFPHNRPVSAAVPVLVGTLTPESSLRSGYSERSREKCEALWWLLWFLLSVLQGSALFWCSANDKYMLLVWFCREVWIVSAAICLSV